MESIKGTFKYKHTISLSEKLLKEVDSLYRQYFDELEYNINLGSYTITLNKLEDVLAMDNFGDEKIKTMTIGSFLACNIKFEVDNSNPLVDASSTVEAVYRMDTLDNANNYMRKLEKILDKGKRSKVYEFFSHISIVSVWLLLTVIFFFNSVYSYDYSGKNEHMSISPYMYVLLIICVLAGFSILYFIVVKVKKLFPPIVFYWGEEKKAEEKRQKIRAGLFWTVIIGLLVGIVSGLIVNYIL